MSRSSGWEVVGVLAGIAGVAGVVAFTRKAHGSTPAPRSPPQLHRPALAPYPQPDSPPQPQPPQPPQPQPQPQQPAHEALTYPVWHAQLAPLAGKADVVLSSGCRPDANGNITCAPEAMRANAEQQLQASNLWPKGKPLDLATYTLARNIQSEVGSSTIEERVALAESTVNQGLLRGATNRRDAALNTALYRQPSRLYGQINNPSGGSLRSGRFTATSSDPTILSTLIADFVLDGRSGDFARGADDQDGLEYRNSFPVPMDRVLQYAKSGSYWIGPLPGVDHWRLSLFRHYGIDASSREGQELIERARGAFGNPTYDSRGIAIRGKSPMPMPAPTPTPASSGPSSSGPQLARAWPSFHGARVLIFGDSLSHPGVDSGPTVTDVDSPGSVASSSAPGAVLASHLLGGINGQRAQAVRINARVGRSARSFLSMENGESLMSADRAWKPTRVIVALSTNDIDGGMGAAELEQTKAALRKIRDAYRAMGADVVAIGPPIYLNDRYSQAAPAMLAALREVFGADRVLDARPFTAGPWRATDGAHFTQAGSAIAGKLLAQAMTASPATTVSGIVIGGRGSRFLRTA